MGKFSWRRAHGGVLWSLLKPSAGGEDLRLSSEFSRKHLECGRVILNSLLASRSYGVEAGKSISYLPLLRPNGEGITNVGGGLSASKFRFRKWAPLVLTAVGLGVLVGAPHVPPSVAQCESANDTTDCAGAPRVVPIQWAAGGTDSTGGADSPGGSDLTVGAAAEDRAAGSLEDAVRAARRGLDERLFGLSMRGHPVPRTSVSAKGRQVSVRVDATPGCDLAHLILNAVTRLSGINGGAPGGGETAIGLQAWDSPVAWHLELTCNQPPAEVLSDTGKHPALPLVMTIFVPLLGDSSPEINFMKGAPFTPHELDAIASAALIAGEDVGADVAQSSSAAAAAALRPPTRRSDGYLSSSDSDSRSVSNSDSDSDSDSSPRRRRRTRRSSCEGPPSRAAQAGPSSREEERDLVLKLKSMGVKVYGVRGEAGAEGEGADEEWEGEMEEEREGQTAGEGEGTRAAGGSRGRGRGTGTGTGTSSWEDLAGYEEQKREIEDNVLLALKRPDVYDKIARGTRRKFESNRPRALLFDGPPGTGKTSSARVIASQDIPLLYVPLEVIASKWYGESERALSAVFAAAQAFPNGAIVFLDEVDALATARDSDMHEATRRTLSVLLREIDGFERNSGVVLIAATNRKEDLDPALLSRFDAAVTFGLPDAETRQKIVAQYARQLSSDEAKVLAEACDGMSGRDIRDVCEQAERRWASQKLIRSAQESGVEVELPPLTLYVESAAKRKRAVMRESTLFP